MVFAADNGTKLNTLADVLNLTKGKTVLLDMWGTWCGPCRSEIEKNGAAIKEHFKNKGLDYFYIANYDQSNEATWKKLIAFFKLTGTHILANEKLTDDIMKKTNGSGYPTYVVIKKDGSYELSKAGYPMDRDVLIKQLEEALAVK
jgi:thiol-disulfide isomerase/thioredoxin